MKCTRLQVSLYASAGWSSSKFESRNDCCKFSERGCALQPLLFFSPSRGNPTPRVQTRGLTLRRGVYRSEIFPRRAPGSSIMSLGCEREAVRNGAFVGLISGRVFSRPDNWFVQNFNDLRAATLEAEIMRRSPLRLFRKAAQKVAESARFDDSRAGDVQRAPVIVRVCLASASDWGS